MKSYEEWAREARLSGVACKKSRSKDRCCIPLRDDAKCRACFNEYCAMLIKEQREAH